MNYEAKKYLKLSVDPRDEKEAIELAVPTIERFLDQLDGSDQVDLLRQLIDGSGLVELHGEEAGRELAGYRLAILMEHVGRAAGELADINVFDVVVEGEDTTTATELEKLAKVSSIK